MDIITEAIIAGVANLSKDAIKDSYNTLKSALNKKFGSDSEVVDAVNKLEKTPHRDDRKATVKAELEIAKVHDDVQIVSLAKDLLDKLKEKSGEQQTINQTQTNVANRNTVGGNFNFSPHQKGS